MLSTLYILNYNNYYNRIVKSERNITDYLTAGTLVHSLSGTNFNPNDFINTEHTFGDINNQYNGTGDYVLVTENNEIVSKWFIIEAQRSRSGQWILTLRRDVIVDYWDLIKTAPTFIEKGLVSNDSPFILNNEDMTVNQIKTAEYALKDGTGCPWIVGYYDSTHTDGDQTNYKMYIDEQEPFPFDIAEAATFENWEYYKYISEDFIGDPANLQYITYAQRKGVMDPTVLYEFIITNNSDVMNTVRATTGRWVTFPTGDFPTSAEMKQAMLDYYPHPQGLKTFEAQTYNGSYIRFHNTNSSASKKFKNLNGKIIRFSSNVEGEFVYKKITIKPKQATYTTQVQSGNLYNSLSGVMENLGATDIPQQNLSPFYVSLTTESYRIEAEDIIPGRLVANISKTAYNLIDAPYSMFAIPYPSQDQELIIKNGNVDITINAEAGMRAAMAFAKKYAGGSVLYDIQLLPYCPIQSIVKEDGSLNLENDNLLYSYITVDDENVSVVLNASVSSFTLNIPFEELSIENPKIQAQTDMCRLVSPNYNGQFEFNIVKNGGLQFFNVDCTYLPHTPYIHINPNFGRLYGQDFNDARGLICGGDFSLPIINDAWAAYKIQNKNFQNIFDRQIQNMEIQNKYQHIQDVVSAFTGTLQGTVSGASAGFMASGSPYGAIAGGIVGGAASMAGGVADVAINQALRNEAIDFTKDNFGYQLGNIQALPNSLSRTTAYTYNNKIFPILEYYTCTEEEKTALANKIAYNGMTIMVIGTLEPMLNTEWSYKEIKSQKYFKGKVIRLNSLGEDFHVAKEVSNEINNGFFYEYVN